MDNETNELYIEFLEESRSSLKNAEFEIIELESHPDDKELINSVFRCYHSIKGSSGFMGLDPVVQLTHKVENVLVEIKNGKGHISKDLVSLLLKANDALIHMFQRIEVNPETFCLQPDEKELIDQVDNFSKGSNTKDLINQSETMLEKMVSLFSQMEGKGVNASVNPDLRKILGLIDTALEKIDIKQNKRPVNFDCVFESVDYAPLTKIVFAGIDKMRDRKVTDNLILEIETALRGIETVFQKKEKMSIYRDTEKRLSDFKVSWKILEDSLYQEVFEDFYKQFLVAMHEGFIPTYVVPVQFQKEREERDQKQEAATDPKKSVEKFIRIHQDKLDEFMNQVGELIITTDVFNYVYLNLQTDFNREATLKNFKTTISQLDELSSAMQNSIMEIRKIPLTQLFQKFTRLIREVSNQMNKKVRFEVLGEKTEIDKNLVELIEDPLVHLLRNAIDHGLENNAEERQALDKPPVGTITLSASVDEEWAYIDLRDDGRGLNADKIKAKAIEKGMLQPEEANALSQAELQQLILKPGFSTATTVSDISGRGVGMDVVVTNLEKLGGTLSISSEINKGSTFSIKLPMTQTMVTKEAVIIEHQGEQYVLAADIVKEIINVRKDQLHHVDSQNLIQYNDSVLPLRFLGDVFGFEGNPLADAETLTVIVVTSEKGQKSALVVDEVLKNQKVVIRKLKHPLFRTNKLIEGFTLLGSGNIALAINPEKIFD